MAKEASGGKRVVVVGGGIGGGMLAKSMQFAADVTLIDPKEYFEIPWANLRSMVEPPFADRTLFNHSEYLTNGKVIAAPALSITEKEVLTVDGHSVGYDYLIVATGHDVSVPKGRSDRIAQFEQVGEKIKNSSSVLIIGGGPVGVELAGEIAVDFPEKKVTIVHKGHRLLEFIGEKASKKALKWLTARNVQVLLNQSVDLDSISEGDKEYTSSTGEKITADCHFVCVGKPLGSSWLHDSLLKDCLDKRGRLMVDENLRVKGWKNIFAIGDITDVPEIKQGFMAQGHAAVVAKNLKLMMKGAKESKLAQYKPSPAIAIVSLGRKEGLMHLPFTTMLGCLPGLLKSKDLFVGRTRKQMGVQSSDA